MSISFIWFDLGYTLLYSTRERLYHAMFTDLGHSIAPERFEREYHLVDKLFMRDYPGVFGRDPATYAPWFLGVLGHRLGIGIDVCPAWQWAKRVMATDPIRWLPFDGVAEALADLRRRGHRLGVITNWDLSARGILAAHDLDGYFEKVVVSCEVGCEKPDRRIFDLATSAAGVAPEECLYVGDNYYVDTVGARASGMTSVIVNRFGTLGVEEIVDVPIVAHIREIQGWLEPQNH
ncbi:MAG TPA: HAD family hydrolase [Desulfobacterales bacterium]|nr:HAD family hydrolase [Desulfobacterales bacterium]